MPRSINMCPDVSKIHSHPPDPTDRRHPDYAAVSGNQMPMRITWHETAHQMKSQGSLAITR
eukprot:3152971-Pyramimonas_sp.AAC.2